MKISNLEMARLTAEFAKLRKKYPDDEAIERLIFNEKENQK